VPLFIIDTNVVVAGLITSNASSATARILDAMLDGKLMYVLSPALLQEYRQVLWRPKLTALHRLDDAQIDQILADITSNALWRDPTGTATRPAPDPGDNHLWALLEHDRETILVTGDRLLLQQPAHKHSTMLPATFCSLFLRADAASAKA